MRASRPAGTRNNREYAPVELDDVAPELVELAYDPQTAGGLLVSLPRDKGPALEAEFARAGAFLARVGAVEPGAGVGATVSAWKQEPSRSRRSGVRRSR